MVDLSIIIVSYNAKDFLKKCLASIAKSVSEKFSLEVIVVDNASEEGTVEEIKNEKLNLPALPRRQAGGKAGMKNDSVKIRIVENKDNIGFSKANNIGVKQAQGRYILFLNPDTEINKEALEIVIQFMEDHKDCGAATCRLVMADGTMDDACHRGFPTPWNAFCHFFGLAKLFPTSRAFAGYSLGWMDMSKTHEIDACAGSFMIVRREAGEDVGWWDEDYFFYGEDLDFCYELKNKGWKIYFIPEVSILHYKGVSSGIKSVSKHITTADRETKARAQKSRFEAMKIFYKKHYRNKYPLIVTDLVLRGIGIKYWLSKNTL